MCVLIDSRLDYLLIDTAIGTLIFGGGFAPRQPPGAPAEGSPRRRVTLANPGAAERPSPRRRVTLAS